MQPKVFYTNDFWETSLDYDSTLLYTNERGIAFPVKHSNMTETDKWEAVRFLQTTELIVILSLYQKLWPMTSAKRGPNPAPPLVGFLKDKYDNVMNEG